MTELILFFVPIIIRWFKFLQAIVAVFKPILHAFQLFMLLVKDVLAQPIQYIFVSRTVPWLSYQHSLIPRFASSK